MFSSAASSTDLPNLPSSPKTSPRPISARSPRAASMDSLVARASPMGSHFTSTPAARAVAMAPSGVPGAANANGSLSPVWGSTGSEAASASKNSPSAPSVPSAGAVGSAASISATARAGSSSSVAAAVNSVPVSVFRPSRSPGAATTVRSPSAATSASPTVTTVVAPRRVISSSTDDASAPAWTSMGTPEATAMPAARRCAPSSSEDTTTASADSSRAWDAAISSATATGFSGGLAAFVGPSSPEQATRPNTVAAPATSASDRRAPLRRDGGRAADQTKAGLPFTMSRRGGERLPDQTNRRPRKRRFTRRGAPPRDDENLPRTPCAGEVGRRKAKRS